MTKPTPFRRRRSREVAAYVLALSARFERMSKSKPWIRRRAQPERLGNHLQRLTQERPVVVFVMENLVADVIDEIDRKRSQFRD
jgi:hypothetical protein